MANRLPDRLVNDTAHDFYKLAVELNDRRRAAHLANDMATAVALGAAKILLIGIGHVMAPDQITTGKPTDLLADTLAARYAPGGLRALHVPERMWAEFQSVPLFQRWLSP